MLAMSADRASRESLPGGSAAGQALRSDGVVLIRFRITSLPGHDNSDEALLADAVSNDDHALDLRGQAAGQDPDRVIVQAALVVQVVQHAELLSRGRGFEGGPPARTPTRR